MGRGKVVPIQLQRVARSCASRTGTLVGKVARVQLHGGVVRVAYSYMSWHSARTVTWGGKVVRVQLHRVVRSCAYAYSYTGWYGRARRVRNIGW